jgi:hypothetical protein
MRAVTALTESLIWALHKLICATYRFSGEEPPPPDAILNDFQSYLARKCVVWQIAL